MLPLRHSLSTLAIGALAWVGYQDASVGTENVIYHRRQQVPEQPEADPAPVRIFYASRRKRWRGSILILAAIGSAAWLVWSRPALDFRDPVDLGLVMLTWVTFFVVSAVGIERCFEPMPTLAARPEGLVLFPATHPDSVVAWQDLRSIGVCRFGPRWWPSHFLDISVNDPAVISRHLPLHLRAAYRIDRWMAGDTSYYRAPADFDMPLAEVAEELEAWRLAYGPAPGG